ncbi:helix-turn-helix domain-containing protein [Brevibacillus migulae]|uniref:helix-turn-helix domain-containing protein n=1 Tax=Brevibacillus migulae TaxID=1644114 RepID=UPI00106E8B08|nr:RodZ domain-containing protein [Brevibacillus migulae]
MSELGLVLQKAREEKGISLDDIQRITKIQRRYLEAIERGHFHLLPGHFYARAFIKSYAEAVGLDPTYVLDHFQTDLPAQPPQEQLERLRRRRAASVNEPLQAGRWVSKTLLVLFVVLIFGVIYMAFVNNQGGLDATPVPGNSSPIQPGVQTQPAQPGTEAAVPPPAQVVQPPAPIVTVPEQTTVSPNTTVTFESQQGKTYNFIASPADKVTLKVTASDRCWFEVREYLKKKTTESAMLNKGDEKVFELPKNFTLVVGAPTAVQITVNDAPIDMSKVKLFPSILNVKMQESAQTQP